MGHLSSPPLAILLEWRAKFGVTVNEVRLHPGLKGPEVPRDACVGTSPSLHGEKPRGLGLSGKTQKHIYVIFREFRVCDGRNCL